MQRGQISERPPLLPVFSPTMASGREAYGALSARTLGFGRRDVVVAQAAFGALCLTSLAHYSQIRNLNFCLRVAGEPAALALMARAVPQRRPARHGLGESLDVGKPIRSSGMNGRRVDSSVAVSHDVP